MLGKVDTELKVYLFLTNMGVNVYTFDIAAEMEEDGYAGSFIEFF